MKALLTGAYGRISSHPRRTGLGLAGVAALVAIALIMSMSDDPKSSKRVAKSDREIAKRLKTNTTTPMVTTSISLIPVPTTAVPVKLARVTTPEPDEPASVRNTRSCASTGSPTTGELPGDDRIGAKRWVTVARLEGNCDKTSAGFKLGDYETRIVLRSDADTIAAFITTPDGSTEDSAGFADFECTGPCSDTSAVVNLQGSFALRVQAGNAPWQAEVQQYR